MRIDKPAFTLTSTLNPAEGKDRARGTGFVDTLREAVDSVNRQAVEADKAAADLSSGTAPNIHEAMIAMQKASISMQLMVNMTNKLIEGYNELTRLR